MMKSLAPLALGLAVLGGCATRPEPQSSEWPRYTLRAEQVTRLNPHGGGRFDASALLWTKDGALLTVNNREPRVYQIELRSGGTEADLRPRDDCFPAAGLSALLGPKGGSFDFEGLAQDDQGRLYVCDEFNRWIVRRSLKGGPVERLAIDWTPVADFFSGVDRNASFEGIAIGRDRLYVANERSAPVIIVVDLPRLQVVGHFVVTPRQSSFFGTHYSDLAWFDGRLWVLCRQHRVVLEVEPRTHAVLAEFDYRPLEDQLGYRKDLPVGIMEGLAVDRDSIWLLTDNNGFGRRGAPQDIRPTLVRCPRPDRGQPP